MRNIGVFILVAALFLGFACSKDKPTTPGEPEETLLVSATIGSDGGVLETDDIGLTVPTGAFSTDVNLALYEIPSDNLGADEIVTGEYKLTGIPEDYSQPLRLRIKHNGALEGEHFLAIGLPSYIPNVGDTATTYKFYSATDSSGYLVGDLPVLFAADSLGKPAPSLSRHATNELIFRALGTSSNARYQTAAGHFMIYYPLVLESRIVELAGYLEAAYDTLTAMGFTYAIPVGWHGVPRWPIDVYICRGALTYSPSSFYTPLVNYTYSTGYAWGNDLDVDGDKLAESVEMPNLRRAAGREFTRFVLSLHDQNLMLKDLSFLSDRYDEDYPVRIWWHHAVAIWCAGKFPKNGNYIPTELQGNEMIPFTGLGNVTTKTSLNFGYGLAPLVKHLGDEYGNNPIFQTCLAMNKGVNPIDPLIENMPVSEAVWWPAFFQKYLQGNIYGVGGGVFTKSTSFAGTMDTDSDTLKEFPDTYPDLSAKLYRVDLDSNKLSNGANISFEVDATQTNEDYVTTQIYRVKDNKLEFIAEGLNVTVGGVKEIAQEGYDLIACVVNASNEAPYTGSSPLELTVRVVKPPLFTWCRISVGLTVVMLDDNDTTHYEADLLQPRWTATGQMEGNSFTWDIDSTYHGNTNTHGTMSVTIDPGTMTVLSFSANATTIDAWGISRWSIAGTALPQESYIPDSELTCQINGTATCGRITDFAWSYESYASYDTDVVNRRCKSTAYLSLSLQR